MIWKGVLKLWLKILPGISGNPDINLNLGERICVKDSPENNCVTDNSDNSSNGAIRLTITDIIKTTDTSLPTIISDNVIDIYLLSTTGNRFRCDFEIASTRFFKLASGDNISKSFSINCFNSIDLKTALSL